MNKERELRNASGMDMNNSLSNNNSCNSANNSSHGSKVNRNDHHSSISLHHHHSHHHSHSHHFPESMMEGDLILQALAGFLLILTCDGEVFYASHTVETYLGFHQVISLLINWSSN